MDGFVGESHGLCLLCRLSKSPSLSVNWQGMVRYSPDLVTRVSAHLDAGSLTGSPIQTKPSFNPMIGPSPYVLINMGSRYSPCMKTIANVQNRTDPLFWPCPNATTSSGDSVSCQLSDLCGLGGVPNPEPNGSLDDPNPPNQWFRFVIPIFLHAGIIHIGFNLLLQLMLGRDVELLIGSVRFALLYFAAGIFGFVLGGNFAATGISSCGCSGSLFGILAITLLDLLYSWSERRKPWVELTFIIIDMAIAFALGLLPGLDNFSHIGGFLMGLVLGICILRSPKSFSEHQAVGLEGSFDHHDDRRHSTTSLRSGGLVAFVRAPLTFFQHRKSMWWAWWGVRAAALVGALVGFILLLKNFYVWRSSCSWCRYLSCLPITVGGSNWCEMGTLDFHDIQSGSTPPASSLGG